MAYIEPLVATELTALSANPAILSTLSFKTREFVRKARCTQQPSFVPGFAYAGSTVQTAVITTATALATS